MIKLLPALALFLSACFAIAAHAQQEIRLKSGATFFGVARFEGDDAIVKVGESELRFPREEVALIQGGAASTVQQQPLPEHRRLLNAALEAKLLDGATKEVVGLLAQAAQLAPDDPQIRFWYVTSLVDAGYGKAADEALVPHREAVAKAYPGAIDRLAARIEARKKLEGLPPAMVARIDRINAMAESQSPDDDERRYQIAFRVVDQHAKPIKQSSVHMEGYANNQELESFGNGYYLYTFTRGRGNANNPVKLTVDEVGIRPEEFEAPITTGALSEPKEFVVHRVSDEDLVPIRVRVAGRDDKPIANAKASLRPNMRRGSSNELHSGTTDENGVVEFKVVPFNYFLEINAEGFKPESQSVAAGGGSDALRNLNVKLYPLLRATIRVAWRITPTQPDGETTTGEGTVPVGVRAVYGNDSDVLMRVLRPMQVEDRLVVHLHAYAHGGYPGQPGGEAIWLRALDVEAEEGSASDAVRKKFDQIDLKETARYKEELEVVDIRPVPGQPPGQITPQKDRIFIGEMPFRDQRTGRPATIAFKFMVEGETAAEKDE